MRIGPARGSVYVAGPGVGGRRSWLDGLWNAVKNFGNWLGDVTGLSDGRIGSAPKLSTPAPSGSYGVGQDDIITVTAYKLNGGWNAPTRDSLGVLTSSPYRAAVEASARTQQQGWAAAYDREVALMRSGGYAWTAGPSPFEVQQQRQRDLGLMRVDMMTSSPLAGALYGVASLAGARQSTRDIALAGGYSLDVVGGALVGPGASPIGPRATTFEPPASVRALERDPLSALQRIRPQDAFSAMATSGATQGPPDVFSNLFPGDIPRSANIIPNSRLMSMVQRRLAYVVLEDGTLVVGKNGRLLGQGHIDLAQGKPVLAAGEFGVLNGQLRDLDNQSGHYRPSGPSARQQAETAFQKLGFDTTDKYVERRYD